MEIKLTLALPRDEYSVPVVRRLLHQCMEVLGVRPDVTADIELALTEACTNVLDHSGQGDDYEVSAGIDGDQCVLEVIDRGGGFDGSMQGLAGAAGDAESGRGIQLMRALVDRVEFTSRPSRGTVVHLERALEWVEGSVIQKWTAEEPGTEHGPWGDDETMDDAPQVGGQP